MTNVRTLALAIVLCTATGGCQGAGPPDWVASLSGAPYEGDVALRIEAPGAPARRMAGSGSATFTDHGDGRATLALETAMGGGSSGDLDLVLDGRYDARGWQGSRDGLTLRIAPDGSLSGEGVSPPNRYVFAGRLQPARFDLQLDLRPQAAGAGGAMAFRYALARAPATAGTAAGGRTAQQRDLESDPDGDKPCRKMGTRMRSVANVGGGGMSMVAVPACLD